jgi:hypothetical protein
MSIVLQKNETEEAVLSLFIRICVFYVPQLFLTILLKSAPLRCNGRRFTTFNSFGITMLTNLKLSAALAFMVVMSVHSAHASSASQSFDDGVNDSVLRSKQWALSIEYETPEGHNEIEHDFRVSAVPELSNYFMLLAGLTLLALGKKRRL